jgi:hypothetical protein
LYPYDIMRPAAHKREFPAELARAGETRQFIAWTGAVAGLRGGSLSDLAVAAEALLTDVLLSVEEGTLEVESGTNGDTFELTLRHPEMHGRRMAGLEGIMEQYLDGYRLSSTEAVLFKQL